MYRSQRTLFCILALLLVALPLARTGAEELPRASAEMAGFSPPRLHRIDALLKDAVESKQIAGGVALVARRGKVVYWEAIGLQDTEAKQPMSPDTIFRIASMTKPVTSAAALMLVEEGRLRLDDPVSKYLPEFRAPKVVDPGKDTFTLVPARRQMTVHDLLTHTSGLTYRFRNREHLGDLYRTAAISDGLTQTEGTLAANVRRLAGLPLLHHPGSSWEYGLSTDVLGRVIEVASGKDLDGFFRERIFEPLKMRDTTFFLPPEKRSRLAALYRPGPDKSIVRVGEEPVTAGALVYSASWHYQGPRSYFSGGAGLVSTASDYARFLQMLLNGGELGGVRLLKPATVKQMTANQIGRLAMGISGHGDRFGYGFGVVTADGRGDEVASVGTYSWGGIFHTYFWADPHKEMIGILLTQVYPFNHLPHRSQFKKLTYEALVE
jgi:CubicO group peptidase (beta-lactamase class C family)